MLTEIGKFLRKLRIDKGEILRDMAMKLEVSSAFLSAVENGKKKIPDSWLLKLQNLYSLDQDQMTQLKEAVLASSDTIELNIANASEERKRLAISFARQFESLDDDLSIKIFSLLHRNKEQEQNGGLSSEP